MLHGSRKSSRFLPCLVWSIGAALVVSVSSGNAECTHATYAKLRPPKYPPEAAANRVAGKVLVAATVGIDGVPENVVIEKSSGSALLDSAALESVSAWRFKPRRCDGKAEREVAVVPVDFDLTDTNGAPPLIARSEKPAEAGNSIASEVGREVAQDNRPMEFADGDKMLRYLRETPGIQRVGGVRKIGPTMAFSSFFDPRKGATWEVLESSEGAWNAVSGGWISIVRTRFQYQTDKVWELYSRLCTGSSDWCAQVLDEYLLRMRTDPPPIPPPAPVE